MNHLFIDANGTLRSGWRALFFLLAFAFVSGLSYAAMFAVFLSITGLDAVEATDPKYEVTMIAVGSAVSLAAALGVGYLCARLLEKLPFRSLGASFSAGWLRHLSLGVAIGAATLVIAALPAMVFGGLRFEFAADVGFQSLLYSLATAFVIFAAAAAYEEALFRGYFLQTLARGGYAWLAIILTSVFFATVHLGNPSASAFSTANTAIAGIWFGIAYMRTRDLWFVWGLHLMWNFFQGSVFGIEVSGLTDLSKPSLLNEIDAGPNWLTGGSYGIEASIGCTAALLLSILIIRMMPALEPNPKMLAMTSPASGDSDLKGNINSAG
ncbi:MAG: CPBP family intramembrane metalloprotease [Acidobacteriota bacterium]|nr:MAG: CPBP family intramembrane metalloprotease [Acidobacteriota bacterium]